MKGKVITIIGIIIMILVGASYILFEAFVKDTSNVTAQNVVVAKATISEDTVIHNSEEAKQLFEIKRLNANDIVEGAIVVNSDDLGDKGLLSQLQDYFSTNELSDDEVNQLIGFKITRNYAKNEQILIDYLSKDVTEFEPNERLFAIETSYINSVAAEISVGDYVDLWLVTTKNNETKSQKIIGPLKIYKLKTSDNVTITDGNSAIPSIVLFKLDEETIQYVSALKNEGTIFFVKYGATPSKDEINNALENAKESSEVTTNDSSITLNENLSTTSDANTNSNNTNTDAVVNETSTNDVDATSNDTTATSRE